MKRFAVIVLLLTLCFSPKMSAQVLDSANIKQYSTVLDSLHARSKIQFNTDSFKILTWADTLKNKISNKFRFDSLSYQNKIDSLKSLRLPTERYTRKLDSISQKKDHLIQEVQAKKDQLLGKTKGRLDQWKSKMQEGMGGNSLPLQVPSSNLPDMPDLNTSFLPTEGLGDKFADLGEIPSLETGQLSDLDLSPDLSSINETVSFDGLDKLGDLKENFGSATDQISDLKTMSSNPDQVIESTLENVEQFEVVKDQLDGMEAIRDNEFMEAAEKLKDPEAMKAEAKEVVLQKAINHFAGKEEVLQQAMDKIAKYKQKYSSLNSLSEIGKRPPNPMKGKPFIERLLPGVGLQILKNDNLLLDVNPYVGYKISGRFSAGMGWNQRIGYSLDENYFTSASVIYGPRNFVDFKAWRGYTVRAEAELMNTLVPAAIRPSRSDVFQREWVKTVFIGFKKEYRFTKSVKGTAFMMFSIYNDHRKSPYGDVINSRFGFEFPLKKKLKTEEK